jgi:cell surface protein SprA
MLYDSTKTAAQNHAGAEPLQIEGQLQVSASSDVISLNSVNIPQGSVSVTAGGVKLDREPGLHRGLQPGPREDPEPRHLGKRNADQRDRLESNSLFSIQTKTLAGARFDYKVNKDLVLGGTIMNLYERPLDAER